MYPEGCLSEASSKSHNCSSSSSYVYFIDEDTGGQTGPQSFLFTSAVSSIRCEVKELLILMEADALPGHLVFSGHLAELPDSMGCWEEQGWST